MKKMIISVVIILLVAIVLTIIPTQNPKFVDIKNKFLPPSAEHIMGTDHLGRDIFSLMAQGFLRTLCVVLIASAVSYAAGLALGIVAGFYGGAFLSVIRFFNGLNLNHTNLYSCLDSVNHLLGYGSSRWSCTRLFKYRFLRKPKL